MSVVDHLLEPEALVKHPHDNQPVLVAGRELRVRRIPGNANLRVRSIAVRFRTITEASNGEAISWRWFYDKWSHPM